MEIWLIPCASLWLRWSKLHTSSLTRSDVTIKFHDVPLVCVDGANFFAHKVVLYSASFNLKTLFKYSKCLQELILSSWWPPSPSPPAGDSPSWDLTALLVTVVPPTPSLQLTLPHLLPPLLLTGLATVGLRRGRETKSVLPDIRQPWLGRLLQLTLPLPQYHPLIQW